MIIGIGCDIVEHDRSKKLKWHSDVNLQKRIFSQKEIDIYSIHESIEFLAGRFAAKEAILKCLGTGMFDGISLTDIQINQLENGKAQVELLGQVKVISDNLGINVWHVSITHSNNCSFASVIAEKFN